MFTHRMLRPRSSSIGINECGCPREELRSILSEVEGFLNDIHRRAAPIVEEHWANTDTAIWFGQEALREPELSGSGGTTLLQTIDDEGARMVTAPEARR